MSEPRQPLDELELKKRARRRLVGALAFATFAAVVLPMVMDETPPSAGHDIDLRIPGQDQPTASPLATTKPSPANVASPVPTAAGPETTVPAPTAPMSPENAARKTEAAPVAAKPSAKAAPADTSITRASPAKAVDSVAKKEAPTDAKRAQAILDGQAAIVAANDVAGAHVVLIGAFANAANVKILQAKLGQLGIKTYTETLESSQGRKTRVRAGPFPNRDGAEKALEKMKRIGVGGVVAPKS